MKAKWLSVVLVLLCQAVMVSGCWSARELNDLAIALGMAIDKSGSSYKVTIQVINAGSFQKQGGGAERADVLIYEEKAGSIFEALRKMTTVAPRKIFMSHLRILIIGEELAKEGINEALEMVSRDHEFRSDFYIVLAKGRPASDMLKITTSLEQSPSEKSFKSVEVSEKAWAPTHGVFLDELLTGITGAGKSAVLTVMQATGSTRKGQMPENILTIDPPVRLKVSGLAVLKKGRLVGYLNEKESKGVNYINENVKNTVGKVRCPNKGYYVAEINSVKSKVKGAFKKGKPHITITIKGEASVGEVHCQIDLTKEESLRQLGKGINARNKSIAEAAIKKAVKLKVDLFGFGETLHQSSPKQWKKIEMDWPDRIADAEVQVHSDFTLRRTGTITNSFMTEGE